MLEFTSMPLAFLGGQEVIVIFLILLLLFGAKKLPELARGLGKSMSEFKRAKDEFEREIDTAANSKPAPKKIEEPKTTSTTTDETKPS